MRTSESKQSRFPIFTERFLTLRGDMSQEDFAVFLGVSRPTVGLYESGQRIPDALTLKTIAEKCGVSADYLLGLSDCPSLSEDAQAIQKSLGLSFAAAENLLTLKKYSEGMSFDFFDSLVSAPEFVPAIIDIERERISAHAALIFALDEIKELQQRSSGSFDEELVIDTKLSDLRNRIRYFSFVASDTLFSLTKDFTARIFDEPIRTLVEDTNG